MDKNTFISIVLGLDALTIGTFGTAAYESGRPIVGIVFLFTLVVISGIAFGFAMSNQKEVRSAKLNETVDTEETKDESIEKKDNEKPQKRIGRRYV